MWNGLGMLLLHLVLLMGGLSLHIKVASKGSIGVGLQVAIITVYRSVVILGLLSGALCHKVESI